MKPLVSVIIPVYRVERYLDECVQSVVRQTYRALEIILVDDGSPDSCPAMCDTWAGRDERIRVIHKTNGGAADSRNAGVRCCSGEWLLFLDADDYYETDDVIEKLIGTVLSKNSDIVCFNYRRFYEKKQKYSALLCPQRPVREDALAMVQRLIYTSSACLKLIRASVLRDNAVLFGTDELAEDIAFCAKLLMVADKVDYCPEAVYVYRDREGSKTNTISQAYIRDALAILTRLVAEECRSEAFMAYTAFQYCTLLINMHIAEPDPATKKQIWAFRWLLQYDAVSQVRLVHTVSRIFGLAVTSRLLFFYFILKR